MCSLSFVILYCLLHQHDKNNIGFLNICETSSNVFLDQTSTKSYQRFVLNQHALRSNLNKRFEDTWLAASGRKLKRIIVHHYVKNKGRANAARQVTENRLVGCGDHWVKGPASVSRFLLHFHCWRSSLHPLQDRSRSLASNRMRSYDTLHSMAFLTFSIKQEYNKKISGSNILSYQMASFELILLRHKPKSNVKILRKLFQQFLERSPIIKLLIIALIHKLTSLGKHKLINTEMHSLISLTYFPILFLTLLFTHDIYILYSRYYLLKRYITINN